MVITKAQSTLPNHEVHNLQTRNSGSLDYGAEFENDDVFTLPPEVLPMAPVPPPQIIKKRFGE